MSEKTVIARQGGPQRFVVRTGSGHEIPMDDGQGDTGPRPTEALLAALVACTAMDVVSLLAKKRQVVTSYTVEGRGRQQEDYPHIFTWIEIVHVVDGVGIEDHAVRRSIELSATKYCPISAMVSVGPTEIHHRYRIRDSATEPPEIREAEVMVTGHILPLGPLLPNPASLHEYAVGLYSHATMTAMRAPSRMAARRGSSAAGGARTIDVAIVGATGYAGAEAVRLLARHPNVRIVGLVGRGREHEPIGQTHAHLAATGLEVDAAMPASDAVFLALPHGAAAAIVPELAAEGRAIIDLGPDFRLRNPADYPRWYKFEHPAPALLADAVYGLPELHRGALSTLADADHAIVGAPGCYPTATLLALAPLAREGLIGDLVVDAKSGVSGAGREPKPDLTFGEVNESVKAYGLGGHRHVAEIEQELGELDRGLAEGNAPANPGAVTVDFLAHLIPMTRGILSACYVRPTRAISQSQLDELYADAYADEPFVRLVGSPPATKHVLGSNFARVHVRLDERTGRVIAIGVIDNLVKGAAGQAIQAFNLVYGLDETAGLEQLALAP